MKNTEEIILQVGICDDVEGARETLKTKVAPIFEEKGVQIELHSFSCGEELLESGEKLDLLFLDIEMPGIGGIEAGKRYRRSFPECKIILATGRTDKMREALAVEPLAFVDKPYGEGQLLWAVEEFLSARVGYSKILLYDKRSEKEVLQRDIQYIYAIESSTEFVLANQLMRREISLNQLEMLLDSRMFFRVDRKHIVNFEYIEQLEKNQFVIQDKRFKVSIRRQKEFRERYQGYQLHHR